jgi:glycosyltransferase involved in cell wall biosynthesis
MVPPQKGVRVKVLFTHPFYWPQVRRGAEREVHDLAQELAGRGHRLRILTGTPTGITQRRVIDGIPVRYVRLPAERELVAFAAPAAVATLLTRADTVVSFLYGDGAGAGEASRWRPRQRVVLKLTGTVRPEGIATLPRHDRLLRIALERADEVWCNSEFAREEMAGFGREMQLIPAGLDTDRFRPSGERSGVPTVFAASSSDEPRKRLVDLLAAWPDVLAQQPDAQLRIAGAASPATRAGLLAQLDARAQQSVTFLGQQTDAQLVREYGAAWAVAMPAVYEALGLVTLEALSCGTPVVAARSGASPELIGDCGALFTPADPQDCARGITEMLTREVSAELAARCRERAAPYDWRRIGDLVQERLLKLH